MFKIVKKAIDEFNPYSLLPQAPNDEFDSESREIASRINVNSTVEKIAEIISEVFSEEFGENFEPKDCMTTAEKIHELMKTE
ncbi:MAG: DUF1871 domain-containing protein [Clostridia bacterium]|nr:DUF1871 domain-containing protein [Clostridia bacterium]